MTRIDVAEIGRQLASDASRWQEVLRNESLSIGVYRLNAGQEDLQQPHQEDEVYVVIEGKATLRVEDDELEATPGVALFVPARAEHRFEKIEEDLLTLVIFAPPESTPA